MSRFVVFLAVALTVAASVTVDFEKCDAILDSDGECCIIPTVNNASSIEDEIKECILMPDVPGSCEKSLCLGTKLGFATADGAINNDKWQKEVEEKLFDHKDILEHMKKQCFDDRYKSFGEPDECDVNKIIECVAWQYVFSCPDFSNEDSCKKIKGMAPKCLELRS